MAVEISQGARSAASYLPRCVVDELIRSGPGSLQRNRSQRGPVLFIDLAGSTPFVVSLCESGQRGIDALQNALSSFYTPLIDEVYRFGGDVYAFSGDAVLAGFVTAAEETDTQAVLRALTCAVRIRAGVEQYESIEILDRSYHLQFKIGMAFGCYEYALLGDPARHTPVILGTPVQSALEAEDIARGGDIMVDVDAWRLVPAPKSGHDVQGFIRLESLPPYELGTEYRREVPPDGELGEDFVSRCAGFFDPGVLRKAIRGHAGYAGEYREITILCVRFSGVGTEHEISETVAHMDEIHALVCHRLADFEATLGHVELGDKGYVFLIVLGTPFAVEAKQEKACRLAFELAAAPPFVTSVQAGIATGYGYCGDIGAPSRREFTITGEVVNRASRLMTYSRRGGIYIDAQTHKRVEHTLDTQIVPDVRLKGIEGSVTIYRLEAEGEDKRQVWFRYSEPMIGREQELARLIDNSCRATDSGRICAIVGEPGIGKSRMVGALLEHVSRQQSEPLLGFCQTHRRFTPYSCWQSVLRRLLGIDPGGPDAVSMDKIRTCIAALDDVDAEWSPVFAEIVGVHAQEQALTRNLDPDQRNRRVSQIIFKLLEHKARTAPIVLCFEDIHWIDDVSLRLIEYVARRIQRLAALLIVVSREQTPFEALRTLKPFRLFVFEQLPDEQARELLRVRLNLRRSTPEIEDRVLEKARGNPFFIESIVSSLTEQGLLVSNNDGTMRLTGELRDIRIPFTLQDLILSRIDRLSEDEKTVLRIGAVIGRDFSHEVIHSLIPASLSAVTLEAVLSRLEALDLTPSASRNPPTYYFKHALIRDVAYETLALGTREQLHRKVGEYAERKFAQRVAERANLLAHHFVSSNDLEKGLEYSLLAARQARRKFSNQDAIFHFSKSLEILDTPAFRDRARDRELVREELAGVYRQAGRYQEAISAFEQCLENSRDTDRNAELRAGLGHVYQEEGEAAMAIDELEAALRLLGRWVPGSAPAVVFAILRELAHWSLRSLGVYRPEETDDQARVTLQKQFDILYLLGKIYFFGNVKKTIWSATAALNVAERLALPKPLGLAYANASVALMSAGQVDRAAAFCVRALDLGRDSDDPETLAQVYMRTGLLGFYTNQPQRSQRDYGAAVDLFRQIGETWEQLTAMGILTTAYAMDTELDTAQQMFIEIEELADELGSKMHLAWAKCFAPFYRYLLGIVDAPQAVSQIEEAIPYAVECTDFGAEILAYGHLCAIAVREADVSECKRLAKATDTTLWRNKGRLPARTPQIALVYAGEAALYARQHDAGESQHLVQIAARGARRAIKLGKNFPYLLGPAMRLNAAYTACTKGQHAARVQFRRAIDVLEKGADRWQAGVGYYEAARWLEGDNGQYVEKARSIFSQYGLAVELRRLEALHAARDTRRS